MEDAAKTTEAKRRRFTGTVVSDKMTKSIVVRIDRTKTHPRYHKKYTVSKRFHVHDPKDQAHVGDTVVIEETRPISKTIRWRVLSVTPKPAKSGSVIEETKE
ncbi:MAG: 30S ribosomal protein S17 [Patescibacteria group bacterium]|jgi:small subunit ribosomal protein S17